MKSICSVSLCAMAMTLVLAFVLLTADALIGIAFATEVTNARCITMLNPATCANTGNSLCNTWAGETGNTCDDDAETEQANCLYCNDSSTSVPSSICMVWEDYCCDATGSSTPCSSTANEVQGICLLVNNTCLCANVDPVDTCGTDLVLPCQDCPE